MTTKLTKEATVARETEATVRDKKNNTRTLVLEITGDGKVNVRLKGLHKVVTIDPVALIKNDGSVTMKAEHLTADKRTFYEHLCGH